LETIETEKLVSQFEQIIVDDVYDQDKPVESVVTNLQEYIKSKGIKVNTVVVDDVYTSSKKATQNVHAWAMSPTIASARKEVQKVDEPRLLPKYSASMPGSGPSSYADAGPEIRKQDLSRFQTHRIVKKSIARNSVVTPIGTSSRKSPGKSVSSVDFYQFKKP